MHTPLYHHFTSVVSTNTIAVELAGEGANHGTIIHADCQTGGRGRAGRQFISPAGGLYFSLILRPQLETRDLPLVTLAAGVGICTTIRQITDKNVQLKWPNDLYLSGQKLAGILTESGPIRSGGQAEFIVIGVGINMNPADAAFPAPLQEKVISLAEMVRSLPDRNSLLQSLVTAMVSSVQKLYSDKTAVLAAWRQFDYLMDRQLNYHTSGEIIPATGRGLADDGQYVIVDHRGTRHHVVAGDLSPIRLVR